LLDEGRAPIGHDGIADIFVDDAAVGADWPRHGGEIAVDDLDEPLRRHALAHRGKALHVAEHDGHGAPLPLRQRDLGPLQQALDDPGIDVTSKRLADALVAAQLLDHPVKAAESWPISS